MTLLSQARVDLQLSGVWTNITSKVFTEEKVQIKRGRSSETASPEAASAVLVVDNTDGRFTPRNPAGAYYGTIGRNTPIRIGVGVPPNGTATGGQNGTNIVAPSVVAEASGTVFSLFAQNSGTAVITGPAGYTMATQQTGNSFVTSTSRAGFKTGISAGTVAAATATTTVGTNAAALTCFIPGVTAVASTTVANGAYVNATAKANGAIAVAAPITVAAGDVLVALVAWSDDRNNAMVFAPVDGSQNVEWTLVADTGGPAIGTPRCQAWVRYCPVVETLTIEAPAQVYGPNDTQLTIYKGTGNAAGSWSPRFLGACSEFNTQSSNNGKDLRCTIVAGSALRKAGQGTPPSKSACYRYILPRNPVAYWPMEGGVSGDVFASPIAGVPRAQASGVTAGADKSFNCSDALPQVAATGQIRYPMPAYTNTLSRGSCFFIMNLTTAEPGTNTVFSAFFANDGTSATLGSFAIQATSTTVAINTRDGANVQISNDGLSLPPGVVSTVGQFGVWIRWTPNAGSPATKVDFDVAFVDTSGNVSASGPSGLTGTVGQCTSLGTGIDNNLGVGHTTGPGVVMGVGHVMFDSSSFDTASTVGSTNIFPAALCRNLVACWQSETPTVRLRRVCQDEGIFLSTGQLTDEVTDTLTTLYMGQQFVHTGLDLINQCLATDGGELTEARGFGGLMYRQLATLCARPVLQVVDYNQKMIAAPFAPSDDDQLTRNDITVNEEGGGSARVVQSTGTLSTMAPPNGVGPYATSTTINVFFAARDLPAMAAWLVSLGTVDQERFKAVRSLLEAVPASVVALSLVDVGCHIQLANTPTWVQPGPSDQLVIGCTEVLGAIGDWAITWACRPYAPFNVARLDAGDGFARLDSSSSSTTSTVTSGATSFQVTTTLTNDLWGTGNPPFDIIVAGERMTVTAIAGATSPQTFTVTRSVNGVVKSHAAGEPVHVFYPIYVGLSGGS